GDQYEQEADRFAEQVMRMPAPSRRLQRKCGCAAQDKSCDCGNKEVQIQRAAVTNTSAAAASPPSLVHDVLPTPGQPLDHSTRTFFEQRFQWDFGHVRVHNSSHAAD